MSEIPVVFIIGGSDPSSGAGIQADIRTATRLGIYPCSTITTLTAQNSMTFSSACPVDADLIKAQMESVLSDFKPSSVKIGMLPNPKAVDVVAETLSEFGCHDIVVDPILRPTLMDGKEEDGMRRDFIFALCDLLFPLATIVTPNILEFEEIEKTVEKNFAELCDTYLLKGGHSNGQIVTDTLVFHSGTTVIPPAPSSAFPTLGFSHSSLFDHNSILPSPYVSEEDILFREFSHQRVMSSNTHGSGCVLSTAIACGLAKGLSLVTAVEEGITFTANAMKASAKIKLSNGEYGPTLI